MKKRMVTSILFSLAMLCAGSFAFSQEDISTHRECAVCGMDRKAYGYSRMLIEYEDGTTAGVCSLHCAVLELSANPERTVNALRVADRDTRELVAAEKAVWVMGGSKRGVMTQRPKWTFSTRAAAEAFIKEYGGSIVTGDEALAAAREETAGKSR